jgi:hypothetical protein
MQPRAREGRQVRTGEQPPAPAPANNAGGLLVATAAGLLAAACWWTRLDQTFREPRHSGFCPDALRSADTDRRPPRPLPGCQTPRRASRTTWPRRPAATAAGARTSRSGGRVELTMGAAGAPDSVTDRYDDRPGDTLGAASDSMVAGGTGPDVPSDPLTDRSVGRSRQGTVRQVTAAGGGSRRAEACAGRSPLDLEVPADRPRDTDAGPPLDDQQAMADEDAPKQSR